MVYALSVSLAYWALKAYVKDNWALIGSLFLAIHPTLINDTALSFMGSVGAFMASFLIFGSFGRLLDQYSLKYSLLFSLGAILVCLARPFEGLITIIIPTLILIFQSFRNGSFITLVKKFLLPLTLAGLLGASIILIYNYLSTGNPWESAYLIYEKTYGFMRPFIFSPPPKPIQFNHPIMESLHLGRNDYFKSYLDTWSDLYMFEADKFKKVFIHFLPSIGLLLLFFSYALLNDFKFKILILISSGFYFFGLVPVLATHAHYANPIIALNLIIIISQLQVAYQKSKQNNKLWIFYACLLLAMSESFFHAYSKHSERNLVVTDTWSQITAETEKVGGNHLILVKYPANKHSSEDIVYNFAPIDQQKIIYARSMGPKADELLLAYYPDRHIWVYQCANFNCRLHPLISDLVTIK